ncbi:hypothetical protein [Pontibacter burrus]|uniref:PEGA domain-containing protein n=1 Tax=Pontibacter burrus TaxID=2704466 RepID=A0A6B3LYU8_9BACT|nr:hypothetical protein [Pontibacter burrus]NEM98654.1 hypothetical protein [Pontibacter burrus]
MQKKFYAFTLLYFVSVAVFAQSKINITANIPDAKFFLLRETDNAEVAELGVGSIELKLEKDAKNRIKIVKDGYEPLIKEYPRTVKWEKEQKVALENRMVDISVEPYDAEIFVDGRMIGTKRTNLIVGKGKFLTVEIKKTGFAPITKVYYNSPDREVPPAKDFFELKDRQVRLEVAPADAAILVNGVAKGRGNSDITVPVGECVTVTVNREGFADVTQVFCNKPDTDPAPPVRYRAALEDRLVKLTTAPADANIEVNGKIVGVGKYDLKVPKNACIELRVVKDGFIRYVKNYCNQNNMQEPPLTEFVEMVADEAYNSSISTDMANVRITIPVNKAMNPEDAWRTLSSIITRSFDVLETVDYNTGYLTTAWQVQNFNGMSTIRTRVIISSGGSSDGLTYVVKLVSQRADGVTSVKEDQLFTDWERLLKRYGSIVEELQARLQ